MEGMVKMERGDKCLLKRKVCFVQSINRWIESYYYGSYVEPLSAAYTKRPPLRKERYCQAMWAPCKYVHREGNIVYCILSLLSENQEIRQCFLAFIEACRHNHITATGGESLRNARRELSKMIEDYKKEVMSCK